MTHHFDDFIKTFNDTREGEYHITFEELLEDGCYTNQEHQEYIKDHKISNYHFDEKKLKDLFRSIKYPGEY